MNGAEVLATFTIARDAYLWGAGEWVRTVVGPADIDEVERTVVLRGDRMGDVDGVKLKVRGRLRVIHHPAVVVGGTLVERWTEIRVEE